MTAKTSRPSNRRQAPRSPKIIKFPTQEVNKTMKLSEYVNHDATGLASLMESGEVTAITDACNHGWAKSSLRITVANNRCHFSRSSKALEPTSHFPRSIGFSCAVRYTALLKERGMSC